MENRISTLRLFGSFFAIVRDSQDRQDSTRLERWRGLHQLHIQHVEKCIVGALSFLSIRHWTTCRVGSQYACDAVPCSAQVLQATPQIYIYIEGFHAPQVYALRIFPAVSSCMVCSFWILLWNTSNRAGAWRQELANNDELV
jgi:hypothetical protein